MQGRRSEQGVLLPHTSQVRKPEQLEKSGMGCHFLLSNQVSTATHLFFPL